VLKDGGISLYVRSPSPSHIGGPESDAVRIRFVVELGVLDRREGSPPTSYSILIGSLSSWTRFPRALLLGRKTL
jgi:hypothetical protein